MAAQTNQHYGPRLHTGITNEEHETIKRAAIVKGISVTEWFAQAARAKIVADRKEARRILATTR